MTAAVKVLALDFDGVVSDSAPEAFVVAIRAYTELRPSSRLAAQVGDLSRGGRTRVQASALYPAFLELMPLGNRAEDYAVVLGLLEKEIAVVDQRGYDEQRRAVDERFLERFHDLFYVERRALMKSNEEAWLALMGPYPEFVEILRRRSGDVILALATAKDRHSVLALLRAYAIEDLFPEERIVDKEAGISKRAHLTALRERLGVDFEQITFVDDKVSHLERVASLGVRCALAGWGYNGAREREIARARGFLVCTLQDAESELFGPG